MSFAHVFFRAACVERTGALSRRSRTFPHSHRALLDAHRNVAEASDVDSCRHDRVHLLRYPGEFGSFVAQVQRVSFFTTAVYVRCSLSSSPALACCPCLLPLLAALPQQQQHHHEPRLSLSVFHRVGTSHLILEHIPNLTQFIVAAIR